MRDAYLYDHGMQPDGSRRYTSLGKDLALALKGWRRLYKIDPRESRPHYLYRHFDATERLLYVGISLSAVLRHLSHRAVAPWYADIVTIRIERFATKAEAAQAEIEAIKNERPLHNINHRAGSPRRRLSRLEMRAERECEAGPG